MMLFLLALLVITAFGVLLQIRHYRLPIHADTGEFIYRGILEREGEVFQPEELTISWKALLTYWWPREFPGRIQMTLEDLICHGGYPVIQNKALIYQLMTWFYRYSWFQAKDFRFLFGIYHAATIFVLGITGWLCGGLVTGILTALFYAGFSASPFTDLAQIHAEHYAILPLAGAGACLLLGVQPNGWLYLVLAGLLLGLVTILIKLSFAMECLFFAGFTLLVGGSSGLLCFILGIVLFVLILFLIYGLNGQGKHLFCWLVASWRWLRYYHSKSEILRTPVHQTENQDRTAKLRSAWLPCDFPYKYRVFLRQMTPLLLGVGLFVIRLGLENLTAGMLLACYWGAAALLAVIWQDKYYLAHTLVLIAPATLMTALAIHPAISAFPTYGSIFTLLFIFIALFWCWAAWRPYLTRLSPLAYHCRFYQTLENLNTLRNLAVEPIAVYLHHRTGPGDRILQWGSHQELYALAGRRAALKRLESHLLLDPVINDHYLGAEWRALLLSEIAEFKPAYIVDLDGSLNISTITQVTGLQYDLECLFYHMFPVYHLSGNSLPRESAGEIQALTKPAIYHTVGERPLPLKQFTDQVCRWFNSGQPAKSDAVTNGGVSQLLYDWSSLNYSGYWQRKYRRFYQTCPDKE